MDNYAEYDRNKTRGIPRPGAALLHGLVYCGECGHKMVVQYKGATRYICNYLRQQYRVPVCQYIPADAIDEYVVNAFLEALSAVELSLFCYYGRRKVIQVQSSYLQVGDWENAEGIHAIHQLMDCALKSRNRKYL